ncbi:MAG: class I SAM-dependent methyltransferase [Erysipelotrichaceae bacterium]|nr:class I SAM-dependent methyltransferase [Erysipelotrichaceae bacterium]
MVELADRWKDYQIIDAGDRDKLETWHDVVLIRPDPQAIWHRQFPKKWSRYDGRYERSTSGGGQWHFNKKLPEFWTVSYRDLTFKVSPTNFKHTGLFPEQSVNWDWMADKIRNSNRDIKVLNLFAYTGGATMACSKAGAKEVVHVDAAKGMVNWAKENMHLNNLDDHLIRFIVDDVFKFVQREIRRGNTYDIIIMDPPSYGRGPHNELWKLEDQLEELIGETAKLLSDQPLAMLVNAYTTGFSPLVLQNIMIRHLMPRFPDGKVSTVELALPIANSELVLPCGITGRFELNEDHL